MAKLPESVELRVGTEIKCPICKEPVSLIGGDYRWSRDVYIGEHSVKYFISKTQYISVTCAASGGSIYNTETGKAEEAA